MDPELRRLRRALDTMPEAERQVFDRARYRDRDYIQIATELDIPVTEVERLMAGAMRHLMASDK
ncbi:sigma factor-like helix-turn-helix DNA-binding protein [Sphingomonas sp.]|uniref:sigma factor-like helix-turn-helix DNA-binding protein n=1 Tax=Sphingomonas sp. TaxID=28214 RepID=UPI002EDA8409